MRNKVTRYYAPVSSMAPPIKTRKPDPVVWLQPIVSPSTLMIVPECASALQGGGIEDQLLSLVINRLTVKKCTFPKICYILVEL